MSQHRHSLPPPPSNFPQNNRQNNPPAFEAPPGFVLVPSHKAAILEELDRKAKEEKMVNDVAKVVADKFLPSVEQRLRQEISTVLTELMHDPEKDAKFREIWEALKKVRMDSKKAKKKAEFVYNRVKGAIPASGFATEASDSEEYEDCGEEEDLGPVFDLPVGPSLGAPSQAAKKGDKKKTVTEMLASAGFPPEYAAKLAALKQKDVNVETISAKLESLDLISAVKIYKSLIPKKQAPKTVATIVKNIAPIIVKQLNPTK
jgi:hypothetical protein